MIIDYDKKYDEQIKDLLVELQEHLVLLDIQKYNILSPEYRENYFKKVMEIVNKFDGKIYLYKQDDKILGLIVGIVNNEEQNTYEFIAPKRGRIEELVVSKTARGQGIGNKLLLKMEEYLYSVGCKDILLGAFAYNERAVKFYEKHGYHARMLTLTKSIDVANKNNK